MKKWKELNEEEKRVRVNKIKYWVLNGLQMASCVAFGYHLCKYVNVRRRINFEKKYTMADMCVNKFDDGKYGFNVTRLDPKTKEHSYNGWMMHENAASLKNALNEAIGIVDKLEGIQNG